MARVLGARWLGWALAAGVAFPAPAAEGAVDLELAIAVDVSGSIDPEEAELQRRGYVAAFRDPQVIGTIRAGRRGRIAVTYFEWAGHGFNRVVIDWTLIEDEASAHAFADALEAKPIATGPRTSISGAIDFAAALFADNGFAGQRLAIDVSGDGANNWGRPVTLARDAAVVAGITINGLPIVNDRPPRSGGGRKIPDLDLYYRDCVIGGRSAFIIVANGVADFARAIRRKLILEIAHRAPPAHGPGQHVVRTAERVAPPCTASEGRWPLRPDDF